MLKKFCRLLPVCFVPSLSENSSNFTALTTLVRSTYLRLTQLIRRQWIRMNCQEEQVSVKMLRNRTNLCLCKSWKDSWRVIVLQHSLRQKVNNPHRFNKTTAKILHSLMIITKTMLRKLHLRINSATQLQVPVRSCKTMRNGWNLQAKCSRNRARKSVLVSAPKFKNQLAAHSLLQTPTYWASNRATHPLPSHHPLAKWLVSNRRTRTIQREVTEMISRMMISKRRSTLTMTILITQGFPETIFRTRTIKPTLTVAPSYQRAWEVSQ